MTNEFDPDEQMYRKAHSYKHMILLGVVINVPDMCMLNCICLPVVKQSLSSKGKISNI